MWKVLVLASGPATGSLIVVVGGFTAVVAELTVAMLRACIWGRNAARELAKSRLVVRSEAIVEWNVF